MTGMPAWGPTHSDDRLRALVALVERLPDLSEGAFRQLVKQAGDEDHDHQHAHGTSADEPGTQGRDHNGH